MAPSHLQRSTTTGPGDHRKEGQAVTARWVHMCVYVRGASVHQVRSRKVDSPRLIQAKKSVEEHRPPSPESQRDKDRPLTHRERKVVYMTTTYNFMKEDGPMPSKVYNVQTQKNLMQQYYPKCGKNTRFVPAKQAIPPPPDTRATHSKGHDVVYDGKEGDELAEKVQFSKRDSSIPQEFWRSGVKTHWADDRLERLRPKTPQQQRAATAAQRKTYELSSELFGRARLHGLSEYRKEEVQRPLCFVTDQLRMDHTRLGNYGKPPPPPAPVPPTPPPTEASPLQQQQQQQDQQPGGEEAPPPAAPLAAAPAEDLKPKRRMAICASVPQLGLSGMSARERKKLGMLESEHGSLHCPAHPAFTSKHVAQRKEHEKEEKELQEYNEYRGRTEKNYSNLLGYQSPPKTGRELERHKSFHTMKTVMQHGSADARELRHTNLFNFTNTNTEKYARSARLYGDQGLGEQESPRGVPSGERLAAPDKRMINMGTYDWRDARSEFHNKHMMIHGDYDQKRVDVTTRPQPRHDVPSWVLNRSRPPAGMQCYPGTASGFAGKPMSARQRREMQMQSSIFHPAF
ncbi:unnamed protein product [Vitrella brassicaformis CCMP3155]|uniref:Uncharacterized protein n=2 Tax=Vitrella brassicaformis TaxID=1169539 RepID=A0A0G4F9M7_VITBC|nr:unnamed protein product [Vitrella brassicaformis CCMP3155]|eukprot:CEM09069.1 unnamed protein product [Vitrella brassicaformis CCMP3155]